MNAPKISGVRGAQHMGFTVPDMHEALRFFVDVLGCELLLTVGPIPVDAARAVKYNVPEGATLKLITMLRLPGGPNIELFEYNAEHRAPQAAPHINDLGGHHLAFQVEDLAQVNAELRAAGVTVLGEPSEVAAGPLQGLRWVYALTSWGLHVEFVQLPSEGLGVERAAGVRLYRPGTRGSPP